MAKNQFLNWGKLPKMQFHEKILDLFDFTSFFAWTFLNILAHYALPISHEIQGIVWPLMHPINSTTSHETRKFCNKRSKRIRNWTHG